MSEQTAEVPVNDEGQNSTTEDVNARLLRESQENKRKAQELKKQLADLENFKRQKLEEEGNYKSLLEQTQAELKREREEKQTLRQQTLKGNIVSTISRFASDVVDLDDLLNQPKFKSIIEEGIDEDNLSLLPDAAEKYVKAVLEAKPHLKKQSTPIGTHKGGKPAFVERDVKEKSFNEMSAKERADLKIKLMLEKNNPN